MTVEGGTDRSAGERDAGQRSRATYSIPGPLPIDDVDPGSNFLCLGPAMTGKARAASRVLGDGLEAGDGALVVSTESDAATVLGVDERLERAARTPDPPVGVVDCVTESSGSRPDRDDEVVGYVSSPADLTGVGVEFTRHLERFDRQGLVRHRTLVDSLTPFFVYRDPQQVFQFVQVLTGRVASLGGLGFVVGHSDAAMDDEAERLKGLFDGVVEFREREDGGVETRAIGPYATTDEWVPYPTDGTGGPVAETTPPVATPEVTGSAEDPPGGPEAGSALAPGIGSLSSAIDAVTDAGRTLTVCNFDGDPGTLSALRSYFERLNVDVREASLSTEAPRNVALLHQDGQHLASAAVADLANAIAVEGSGEAYLESSTELELMVLARQEAFAARKSWRRHLVRTSRLVESMAWNAGTGTIHAGFQELSRLTGDPGTLRIYERIADAGVEVHLYGRPDAEVDRERFVVHDGDDDEIARSWFVVFTDAGDPATAGALVAEERGPDAYSGFWTYYPESVVAIRDYLVSTYS